MHEGGHGILDEIKKKHHSHDHDHEHNHDHDHNHDQEHEHGSSLTTKVSAGIITAAIIAAFVLWKWFLPSN